MQTFDHSYQLNHQSAPWHTFRYTIKGKDACIIPLYKVRRSGLRKYRQFEDANDGKLFYVGATTIKSIDNEETLGNMQVEKKLVKTVIGNFILTDLDISRRSYILMKNNNIVAQVKRKSCLTSDQHIIEMINIDAQYQAFIFALLVLIDSVLETMQSPTYYSLPMYISQFALSTYSCNTAGCYSLDMC